MRDASSQQIRAPAQVSEDTRDLRGQLGQVVGAAVGQRALGQVPYAFVGIELRRVAGEVHDLETRASLAQRPDGIAVVDGGVVEEQHKRAPQVTQQVADERADAHLVQVVVEEAEVQAQPLAVRTHRDGRDHRDLVALRAMAVQRCLTPWRPGLDDGGDQEEARFVGEDDMGLQPCGVFFTLGHCSRFQRSMAWALRSSARRSGF